MNNLEINIRNFRDEIIEFPYCHMSLGDSSEILNPDDPPLQNWDILCHGDYQRKFLKELCISCVDPVSGEKIEADYGIFFPSGWGEIVYKFSGSSTFYLLTSCFEQSKLAIYIPDNNTLIHADIWPEVTAKLFEGLLSYLKLPEKELSYELNEKPTLFLGFTKNLGHFIWNELSGLESIINLLPRVNKIVLGPYEFLPINKIFPEIDEHNIDIVKYSSSMPVTKFKFPLRVTDTRISKNLRKKIMAYGLSESNVQSHNIIAETKNKIIWINLRKHNKSWINQEMHLIKIIKEICKNYGDSILFILDGTPDTSDMADFIQTNLPNNKFVNATHCSLADSIFLSMAVDFHLCVVGSGLVITNWVSGRRGIAHSNIHHLKQQSWWNNISESTKDVKFINELYIKDIDVEHSLDPSYVNYEIDLNALMIEILMLLRQCDELLRWSLFNKMLDFYKNSGDSKNAVDIILKI